MSKIAIDRSVLEQALEALEADNSKLWPSEKRAAAIDALRAALEQQVEQEPCNKSCAPGYCYCEEVGKPQPPCQPLTDAQINDHRLALAYDSEDLPDPWDFKQGVRAAERAHGIGGEK